MLMRALSICVCVYIYIYKCSTRALTCARALYFTQTPQWLNNLGYCFTFCLTIGRAALSLALGASLWEQKKHLARVARTCVDVDLQVTLIEDVLVCLTCNSGITHALCWRLFAYVYMYVCTFVCVYNHHAACSYCIDNR